MLKFFRRIRRKLLDEGNLKRYLIYAIGEILLVVIGILIALQINNWNEQYKTHRIELETLIDIKGEFEENYALFQKHLREKAQMEAQWENLLIKFSDKSLPDAQRPKRRLPTGSNTLNISFGILNSVLNSGKINIIRNSHLKKALSNWNGALEDYLEEEYVHWEIARNHTDRYGSTILPYPLMKDGEKPNFLFYDEKELDQYFREAFQDLRYKNSLIENYNNLHATVQDGKKLDKAFNALIILLDKEILKQQ